MKRKKSFLLIILFLIFSCSRGVQDKRENISEIPAEAIHSLETDEDLDILLSEIGDSRLVLLGEATHGTSEFYTWRARISKRLIQEKGFRIIAVEADWTDAYPLNNYIRGNSNYNSARAALREFDRWPEWMWANEEISKFAEWLKSHNNGRPKTAKTGFYGLDVYGIWESIEAVNAYLVQKKPDAVQFSREVLDCFAPYHRNEQAYMRAIAGAGENCAGELAALLETVKRIVQDELPQNEEAFNVLQNTLVAVNAENYYRIAANRNSLSWNIRDRHMTGTIARLLERAGPGEKIIIWEHNTHVGDARATDMANAGLVNVGQLVREEYGISEVHIVGFGTYKGKVIAAPGWALPLQVMNVPGARKNSWEWILHRQEPQDKIILMEPLGENPYYHNPIGHRAIGVVYDPAGESGNYVPSVLPARYDSFIFIDKTTALKPIK